MQDACDMFCEAVYAVKEGVQGFYDALLNYAQNMAMFPNKFTIHEQFLEEIPSEMFVALICNGRLAPKVNTVKEFVLEAKAYENSIKTAAHYLEHSMKSQSEQQLLLEVVQSPRSETTLAARHYVHPQPSKLAKRPTCCTHGLKAYVRDANDEQKEEPAEANSNNAAESKGTQENDEEYIEYWGSDSEGLFALTEVPTAKHRMKKPGNEVHMWTPFMRAHKVLLDFENDQVVIDGIATPAHKLELEDADE
ncbi:hypothetical protein C0989_009487 [Termitomyces sp. Mn162]|nr:hypothetical protein C0989_009487 [Termitomyces sp. Mn162]